MPPDSQPPPLPSTSAVKKDGHSHHHKERIGNYLVGVEIGRGSFATVYKGYRSKTRDPIAIKAVSRQKLTTKLLENLESEINILKVISHRNIVSLEDCFNLLLQPATAIEVADGHPLGIPVLKVADFGFARILPAAAMAETLCGSPLYMAPEILRYEKYDAKADLWSVGAVLFEMSVGKPPFRANNHVELLRKIEKGEDRIRFPDESSRPAEEATSSNPVSLDIKVLVRGLLKRQPVQRMGFDEFFQCGVWDGYMTESTEDGSLSLEVSTDSSAAELAASERVREMLES
ncbi:MAG: Serine/threonine-protein kinase, partial [Tremellales sp. Tagirdzhanova-0007]